MIHVAIGFFVVSLTFAALCVVSFVVPGAPSVDLMFVLGTGVDVVVATALVLVVVLLGL